MGRMTSVALEWTPRVVVGVVGGYYGLGAAYAYGVMAAIDRIAIAILLPKVGWVGIGALMPLIQWYGAWGVRIGCVILSEVAYHVVLTGVTKAARAVLPGFSTAKEKYVTS